MDRIVGFEGGKDNDGNMYCKYDGSQSQAGANLALQMGVEHYVNAHLCQPGETRKGIVCILTEEDVEKLNK